MTKPLVMICFACTLLLQSACKKCDNSFATNFDERGECEFLSAASSDIGFSFEGNNYTLLGPENGGVWNGICSDWNSKGQTSLLSWMNFTWNNEVWTLNLEVPISMTTAIQSGMEFTLGRQSSCPDESLQACAIVYLWNEQTSNFTTYSTTDSLHSGVVSFSNVVDGNAFNNPEYWYADGTFRFQLEINGSEYQFDNGFFSNAVIPKKYN